MKNKMRVWWCPQVGVSKNFYVPVESVEEAKKVMDILAAYDCFQYNQNVKSDYSNMGGLEVFDEESCEWVSWEYEDENDYFDDVDEYCENKSECIAEIRDFTKRIFSQVTFD